MVRDRTQVLKGKACGTRLYRQDLNSRELAGRIRALDDLASGKLLPKLPENRE